MFQRHGSLRLIVKAVKENAIGEACRGVIPRRQAPGGFGGEGSFADAPWATEGDNAARLQVNQQLGQVGFPGYEVFRTRRTLQR
jgi:hypothetical protein